MKNLLSSAIVSFISVYVIYLAVTGKMAIFIHPRYFGLTRWMSFVAIIFGLVGVLYFIGELANKKKDKIDRGIIASIFAIFLFTLLGFMYPLKPLSSATLSQRANEINFVQRKPVDLDSFAADTRQYDISEWVYLFQSDPNWERFEGKAVEIEGFLYKDELIPDGFFMVSKFVISCCAVDARPVGLPVQYNWEGEYEIDQWLLVQGKLKLVQYGDKENLVIIPTEITKIEIPEDPYIY